MLCSHCKKEIPKCFDFAQRNLNSTLCDPCFSDTYHDLPRNVLTNQRDFERDFLNNNEKLDPYNPDNR